MKIKKKINIYLTKTELSITNYFFLKYVFKKLEKNKSFNLVIISTDYKGKKYFRENSSFFKNIKWINSNEIYSWNDLNLECPDIFFQAGWTIKPFKHFGKISRIENKRCKIILTADNCFKKNNFRQFIGKYIFRLFYKNLFDYVWVPGESGKKLMIKFGMNKKKIFTGLYTSLIKLYKNINPPKYRNKQFLFIGRFEKYKNIKILIKAFNKIQIDKKKNWKLVLVGSGSLNLKKHENNNIKIIKFSSPSKLLKLYNQSLFFVLPSLKDHWPLVVHEASLCGCFLLLSERVGNIPEFAKNSNSVIFNPRSLNSVKNSLELAMNLNINKLTRANKQGEILAKKTNYKNSYDQFMKIIHKCL